MGSFLPRCDVKNETQKPFIEKRLDRLAQRVDVVALALVLVDKLEIIRSNWEAVGIKTAVKPEERTLYFQRVTKNGEHMIGKWGHESVFPLVSSHRWYGTNLWDEWAHHWAEWFLTSGERGVATT